MYFDFDVLLQHSGRKLYEHGKINNLPIKKIVFESVI